MADMKDQRVYINVRNVAFRNNLNDRLKRTPVCRVWLGVVWREVFWTVDGEYTHKAFLSSATRSYFGLYQDRWCE